MNAPSIDGGDLQRLADTTRWPRYPLLPMTRPEGGHGPGAYAVLLAPGADGRHCLYEKNLFDFVGGLLAPQLVGVRVYEYATAAAVLADGWRVD